MTLDLADVVFVGREGVGLFQRLVGWSVRFQGGSPFVTEQLRRTMLSGLATPAGGGAAR